MIYLNRENEYNPTDFRAHAPYVSVSGSGSRAVSCTSWPWSFPGAMSVGEVVEGRVLRVGEESPGGTLGPRLAGL